MATLYILTYSGRNKLRTIEYVGRSEPQPIVYDDAPLSPDDPVEPGGSPDTWPYLDGSFITQINEGPDLLKFYSIRVPPFARFDVISSQLTNTVQIINPTVTGNAVSFGVSTQYPPWEAKIDGGSYISQQSAFGGLGVGGHQVTVRDSEGFERGYGFVVDNEAAGGDDPDPSGEPAGAVRLRIRSKAVSDPAGDYFMNYGYYYDPATRSTTTNLRIADSLTDQTFNLDTTIIIDRWCVDPGVPPFRERQVTHNGLGGVTYNNVDGVTACQYNCVGTLAATAVGADGRFTVTLTPTGLTGTVRYRLRGGELQTSNVFDQLPTGRYEFEAIETRANGCTASTTIALSSSYGLLFYLDYDDKDGSALRLEIAERDYTGEASKICGTGDSPVALSWPGGSTDHVFGTVRGAECALSLIQQTADQSLALFSGDERLHRVTCKRNGVIEFQGFKLPEQYDVPFLSGPQPFSFIATDGLGTLSDIPFLLNTGGDVVGDWLLLDVVLLCLGKLGLSLPLNVRCNLYPVAADRTVSVLECVKVDASRYRDNSKVFDCGRVLREILTSLQARLYQQDGQWWLERIYDLGIVTMEYFSYSPAGDQLPKVYRSLLRTVEQSTDLFWIGAGQRQSLRPAVAWVKAKEGVGERVNLIGSEMPTDADTVLTSFSGTAPYQLVYQGKDKQPLIRLTGAAASVPIDSAEWLQVEAPQRVPLYVPPTGIGATPVLHVHIKVKAYGQYIPDQDLPPSQQLLQTAQMGVAVRVGGKWTPGQGSSPQPGNVPIFERFSFTDNGEVDYHRNFGGIAEMGPQPVALRFTQPTRGAAADPVIADISVLEMFWQEGSDELADSYTDEYQEDNELLVSRTDEDTVLFHMDTPHTRRDGTLLNVDGYPTTAWQESAGGLQLEIGAWFVALRGLLQRAPAQVLTGTLRGYIGPAALITDPDEIRPGVYLLTDYSRDTKENEHSLTAVQLLNLDLPPSAGGPALPDYLLLSESGQPLLSEANEYLLQEH